MVVSATGQNVLASQRGSINNEFKITWIFIWQFFVFSCSLRGGSRTGFTKKPEKCQIFRDVDALKTNIAINNFLKSDPVVMRVLQSESRRTNDNNGGNVLTITIFFRDKD